MSLFYTYSWWLRTSKYIEISHVCWDSLNPPPTPPTISYGMVNHGGACLADWASTLAIWTSGRKSVGPIWWEYHQISLWIGGISHASNQPSSLTSTTRAALKTNTVTKTRIHLLPLPLTLATRALAVRLAPSPGKRHKGGECRRHFWAAFRSGPKTDIFWSRSKAGEYSLDQEAIVPIVRTRVLLPY